MKGILAGMTSLAVLGLAVPAIADVKTGVDAWGQGDYAKAIAEWRPLAEAGDADAQFNMGQAYKAGKGVPPDDAVALEWFRKAAAQGHARGEDNYGRMLFQLGKRAEAMPYIQRSAARGEPRAQYILGTAYFNGELIARDWVKAYALMTRSAKSDLGPALSSLAQMDKYIPADQRQKGLALAAEMDGKEKEAALAAVQPIETPVAKVAEIREKPKPVKRADVPAAAVFETSGPKPGKGLAAGGTTPGPKAAAGDWRVQLGAFSADSRAEAQWKAVSGKIPGLSGYRHFTVRAGTVVRLQAGPLASQADAETLCRTIRASGADCLIKKAGN